MLNWQDFQIGIGYVILSTNSPANKEVSPWFLVVELITRYVAYEIIWTHETFCILQVNMYLQNIFSK